MTTQPTPTTQREATRDLFAAFADQVSGFFQVDAQWSDIEPTVVHQTLVSLMETTDPLAADVLDAIHAERRRRLSAATREGRRG